MDLPTFIVGIVNAVAWPAVIVVIVILLRAPITARLANLTRFKWKDLEVEFERKIKEIQKEVDKVLPAVREIDVSDSLAIKIGEAVSVEEGVAAEIQEDRFSRLAELSPPAAIIEAWLEVEDALKSVATRHNIPVSMHPSASQLIKLLAERNILSTSTVAILNDLRALRNEAAHARASELNVSQAKEFQALTRRLVSALTQP